MVRIERLRPFEREAERQDKNRLYRRTCSRVGRPTHHLTTGACGAATPVVRGWPSPPPALPRLARWGSSIISKAGPPSSHLSTPPTTSPGRLSHAPPLPPNSRGLISRPPIGLGTSRGNFPPAENDFKNDGLRGPSLHDLDGRREPLVG